MRWSRGVQVVRRFCLKLEVVRSLDSSQPLSWGPNLQTKNKIVGRFAYGFLEV